MKKHNRKIATVVTALGFITLAGCYAEPDYSHYNGRPTTEVTTTTRTLPPGEYGPHYSAQQYQNAGPQYPNAGPPPSHAVVTGQTYTPGPDNGPGYSPE
jgi:hypothetical protein